MSKKSAKPAHVKKAPKEGPEGLHSDKLVLIELSSQNGMAVPAMIIDGNGKVLSAWNGLTKRVDLTPLEEREGQDVVMVVKRGDPETLAKYEAARTGNAPVKRGSSGTALRKVSMLEAKSSGTAVMTGPAPTPGPSLRLPGVEFAWKRHVIEPVQKAADGSRAAGALGSGRYCGPEESAWLDLLFPGYRNRCW